MDFFPLLPWAANMAKNWKSISIIGLRHPLFHLLCDLIVHNFVLQKQTFVSEFFNHPYRNSSRKYKWLQLLEVFNSCNIQILYGFLVRKFLAVVCCHQSYEIKSPPWTILWFRILGIFSAENIKRLCVFMFQTWDKSATEKITVNQCRADYCLKFET